MAVRMKVLKSAAGRHDPRVLDGSSPDKGINWEPGQEIVVTDDLGEKFERSGMAERIEEPVDDDTQTADRAQTTPLETSESMMRPVGRRRHKTSNADHA